MTLGFFLVAFGWATESALSAWVPTVRVDIARRAYRRAWWASPAIFAAGSLAYLSARPPLWAAALIVGQGALALWGLRFPWRDNGLDIPALAYGSNDANKRRRLVFVIPAGLIGLAVPFLTGSAIGPQ